MNQKQVLAIHDISCAGRCSLTVALPILSAAGFSCTLLPTALLSAHTGVAGYTFLDLTDEMTPIAAHWQALGLRFDAVYTGYLGSIRQATLVADIIARCRTADTLVVVDPVMGDDGRLYAGIPPEFAGAMRRLCRAADVIVPNMTEAALLLDEPFHPGPYRPDAVRPLCQRLGALHGGQVVLTGVYFDAHALGAAVYDAGTGAYELCLGERLPFSMNGTGDIFASALVAARLAGQTLVEATHTAVDFTAASMARSPGSGLDMRFGPSFELELPRLMRALGLV